jgi:hypothetical protein
MQVLYFSQKSSSIQAPIKDVPQVPFWTRAACFPRGKLELRKKMVFSCIIKTKWCATSEISGGDELGGQSGGGGGKEGEGRDARGHVVTCTFPKRLRSGGCR